jgi:hypothetical protein
MKLRQLFEAANDSIAFCFGRMNPPTIGHGQVFDTLAKTNKNYRIYISPAQTPKKDNPLDFSTKVKFIKAMFPQHASRVSDDASLNTIMKIAVSLYNEGYRKISVVAGSDRLESFSKLLNDYNGVESAHGMYKFDSIDLVSSGDRDPDADGLEGISASAARQAAREGDLEKFGQVTGAGKLSDELYKAVRSGLGVKENSNQHISPSGVKTNMDPSDDDYAINYGKNGLVAKDRKLRDVDVKTGSKKVAEAPIEFDPTEPMNPMIYGAGSNPAKLQTRMLRAAGQLRELAKRAEGAGALEWESISKNFDELAMNIGQIKHGLEELAKQRKKGGVRSRGIDPNIG